MFSKTKQPSPAPQPVAEPIPPLPDLSAMQQPVKKPTPAPAPTPMATPTPGRTASLLAADLTFEGNLIGSGDLHIDGTVRGDVKVGRLVVGETGNVEGGIQADHVEIRGRVVGAVAGKQVKLVGTAFVDGDISHEQLSIDVGAYFQGRCLQARKVEPTPSVSPASSSSSSSAAVGFTAPSYSHSATAPSPAPAPVDTGQLIELKPASAS